MNKFNLILSLLAVCLFIFSSCTKEVETNTVLTSPALQPIEAEAAKKEYVEFFIPESIALDHDKTSDYLTSLSSEELYQHMLTYKIVQFLTVTDNFEKLNRENPNFTFLTLNDLNYYAPSQLETFKEFEPNDFKGQLRGCNEVARTCHGSVLIVTEKCCDFWFIGCKYRVIYYHANSDCNDPCSNVACGPHRYCSNGYCYDTPTCSPPCAPGESCIGTNCVPN